jgi:hypothetical protein
LARNINDIYNLAVYITRKERGAFISPDEMCQCLDFGQMELFEEYFQIYGINQTVHDAIDIFKVRKQFTSASDGSVSFPSNYLHLLAGAFTIYGSTVSPIRFLSDDELPDALTAQLRAVSLNTPIAVDSSNGFYLYPQSTQTGFYTYLKRPATPVLGYVQVGRTLTYDPNTSVQLEFTDSYINTILSKALKLVGINMDENGIEAFAQLQSKES